MTLQWLQWQHDSIIIVEHKTNTPFGGLTCFVITNAYIDSMHIDSLNQRHTLHGDPIISYSILKMPTGEREPWWKYLPCQEWSYAHGLFSKHFQLTRTEELQNVGAHVAHLEWMSAKTRINRRYVRRYATFVLYCNISLFCPAI